MSTTLDERDNAASLAEGRFAPALRSRGEEFEAAITHGIGAIVAAFGSVYLLSESLAHRDHWCSLGCLLYSIALVGVLTSSTLSHLYVPDRLNRRFRALDQAFIFLLAAGSLSPFALEFLRTPGWLTYYAISLSLSLVGFVSKAIFRHRVDKIALWPFLVVGWVPALAMVPLVELVPTGGTAWIIAGAGCYCFGIIFLVADVRRWKFHAIWHLLVLAACGCHYYCILRYVVQRS